MPTLASAILVGYVVIGLGLSVLGMVARDLKKRLGYARARYNFTEPPCKLALFFVCVFFEILAVILIWPVFLWKKMSETARRWTPRGRPFRLTDALRYRRVRWVGDYVDLHDHLLALWDPSIGKRYYLRTRDLWVVGMSPAFRSEIANIDKKLQGRVLEAIADICEAPLALKGDTKKPLEGNLDGYWRYRIGDYRLIYRPEKNDQVIVLVKFIARSAGYSGIRG